MGVIATITEQSGNDLTDFQVRIEITDPNFFQECSDRKYIECYFQDGSWIPHWVEEFDPSSNKAVIWVKVPSIPANGTVKVLVKVNPTRTEDLSDPEAVFDFYEDFESGELVNFRGATGQLEIASDNPAEGDYYLKVNGNQANNQWVQDLPKTFGRNIVIEGYVKQIETAGSIKFGIFESWNGDINTSAQGYWILYTAGSGDVYLNEPNWNLSTYVSATGESGYNVWRKFKLIITENQVILEFAGVTLTLDSTTFSNFSMWGGYTYRTAGFDRIFIRKYVSPEPLVSVEYVSETVTYTDYFYWGMAKMLSGAIANFMQLPITMEIYANDTLLKTLSLEEINTTYNTERKLIISVLKFEDDSSDSYTTNKQIVYVTDPDGNTRKLAESTYVFIKIAELPLLLGFEIQIPYEDSQMML